MAETEPRHQLPMKQDNSEQKRLKFLEFVQVAAIHAIVCFASLYDYAKENSGPLKAGVKTVEDTVKTVIGPVYEKFHHVPLELLTFVDRKVDNSVTEMDSHVPHLLKQASTLVYSAAHKAPGLAKAVASEVQRSGLVDTAKAVVKTIYINYEPTAKDLCTKYEPVAEQYAVSVWRKLNKLPLFPQVAHIVVPTVAYWSEKYNQTVCITSNKGYLISSYLPLVPTERIAKLFGESGSPVSSSSESEREIDDAE